MQKRFVMSNQHQLHRWLPVHLTDPVSSSPPGFSWAGVGLPRWRGRKPGGGWALWTRLSSAQGGARKPLQTSLFLRMYMFVFNFYFLATCWEKETCKQNMNTRDRNMSLYSRKADLKPVLRKPSTFYCLRFQKTPKGLQTQEQFLSFKCLPFPPTVLLS